MSTRYDILPIAQRRLLPHLAGAQAAGYVLYGGTAVALHLGHRRSIDFDFFSAGPLDETRLIDAVPLLAGAVPLQRASDTWTVLVRPEAKAARPVKLSFFGGLGFGRVAPPHRTEGGELLLASPLDLLGHKLKVLLQRVEAKDYVDVAALLGAGLRLEAGLGAASALFGPAFPPADALRALTYFEGGDLGSLRKQVRDALTSAVAGAGPIEPASVVSRTLT